MQFDPLVHTKEFLLENKEIAFDLAKTSSEFALSPLANDVDLLLIDDKYGDTVAHRLAEHQSSWSRSSASQKLEILSAAKNNGRTVAHFLARYQQDWCKTSAAQNLEVLSLDDCNDECVAHVLAINQPEWSKSKASQELKVLQLAKKDGWSVAHDLAFYRGEWAISEAAHNLAILSLNSKLGTVARMLVRNNSECLRNKSIMDVELIKLEHNGKLLAEEIVENYKSEGFDVPVVAIKLISRGYAYKQSKPMEIQSGESILNQCKMLVEDGLEPLITLKQLQALYSTFAHNVSRMQTTPEQTSLRNWQELLVQSENLIRQHLDINFELYHIKPEVRINCEPADDLLKKFKSEIDLRKGLGCLSELSGDLNQESSNKAQIYY